MKFSYSETWADTKSLLRASSSLLFAIAGAFFFLPALLVGYFIPQPETATTLSGRMAELQTYIGENFHWLFLANVLNMIGAIAIYVLLFDRTRTVGSALGMGLRILPFYFLLSMLTNLVAGFGALWLLLPGIYLYGRLSVGGAAMVSEGKRSPIDAMRKSWQLTAKKGWAVAGFILIVLIVGYILIMAVTSVLGAVFLLLAGRDLGGLLVLILGSALAAAFSALTVVLFAAIYRRLSAQPSVPTTGS